MAGSPRWRVTRASKWRSNSNGSAVSDSTLVRQKHPAIVPPVKLPRIFLLLLAVLALNGCATYTKLRVTDRRGGLISEWVARGHIHRTEFGYRVNAVERVSGPPYSILSKYPDGWRTTVTGPNIDHWRCAKPLWLYDRERE